MKRSQRGFTLVETMVALAVVIAVGSFLLPAIASALRWNAAQAARRAAETAIRSLADRLEAEEDSAWAIFTPPLDAYGSANADGHELDFFLRDAQNRAHFWAYRYDAANHSLQRLLYGKSGESAIADGAPLEGIDDFFARTYPVTALQDSASPVYSALYNGATLHPAEVRFDSAEPWVSGGNQITYVRVRSAHSTRELELSTQTAPSGFTIVLRYTPSPSATPSPGRLLTAAIVTALVIGHWQDCPTHAGCSNAEWPQYFWSQTTTSRFYESSDGGYTWTLFDTQQQTDTGTSGPTGGDVPPPCEIPTADYARVCSPDWTPGPPPGTAGMDVAF